MKEEKGEVIEVNCNGLTFRAIYDVSTPTKLRLIDPSGSQPDLTSDLKLNIMLDPISKKYSLGLSAKPIDKKMTLFKPEPIEIAETGETPEDFNLEIIDGLHTVRGIDILKHFKK